MPHRSLHYAMSFLMQLFVSVTTLSVPLLATQLGASNFQLGILGSLGGAAYALSVVGAGSLSDKLGRKRVIILGALFAGLAYAIMPLSRAAADLIILVAAAGCAKAFFWPVLEAWMAEEGDHEQVRRGLGGFNVSWSAGICAGPLVGGFLYTLSSSLAFLFAAAGTCLVAYLAYLHRKPAALSAVSPSVYSPIEAAGISRILLYAGWAANFASWFVIAEITTLFPKLALEELGMQPWVIGILTFSLGLTLPAVFCLMGLSRRWHNTTLPLICSQLVTIVLLLLLTVSGSAVTIAPIFAGIGAGAGIAYSYSLYYSVIGSPNKGAASGKHEMMLGTGELLGPLLGGAAADLVHNLRAPYVLGAALMLSIVITEVLALSSRARSEKGLSRRPEQDCQPLNQE